MSAEPTPDAPEQTDPVAMSEDIEDLKAQMQRLSAQLTALQQPAEPGASEASDEAEEEPTDDAQEEDEEAVYPPFILRLEPPAYDDELRALVEWVEGLLVRGYLAEPSADARWCPLWFEHPIALARLHALWLAWQELTDPASCGYTGPSVWHRDHYDPCMRELRSSVGPFQGCTKGEHQIVHRLPGLVPSAWHLEDEEAEAG